jgi:phosphoribosyl 1,2-cyclic phosphate phosphodiesterase
MIAAKVGHVDAVMYTHAHADHIHGLDDLRGYYFGSQQRVPIYADQVTMDRIRQGFGYCIDTPPGSNYPPIVEARLITDLDQPIRITGAGGTITLRPHLQQHGDITSLGFRIGDVAYCSDISDFPLQTPPKLEGLDVLIIDALQYRYHPSHLSLEQSLDWIARLAPKHAVLTHMHTPLDYDTVMAETPEHIAPAYDQMSFEVELAELEGAE